MSGLLVKEDAHKIVCSMSNQATWDDLIDEIYVRQVIEQGLADIQAGRTQDVAEIRKELGLPE